MLFIGIDSVLYGKRTRAKSFISKGVGQAHCLHKWNITNKWVSYMAALKYLPIFDWHPINTLIFEKKKKKSQNLQAFNHILLPTRQGCLHCHGSVCTSTEGRGKKSKYKKPLSFWVHLSVCCCAWYLRALQHKKQVLCIRDLAGTHFCRKKACNCSLTWPRHRAWASQLLSPLLFLPGEGSGTCSPQE